MSLAMRREDMQSLDHGLMSGDKEKKIMCLLFYFSVYDFRSKLMCYHVSS